MRALKQGSRAVLLGIGGSGMRGLAKILMERGVMVSGCDGNRTAIEVLRRQGIEVVPEAQCTGLVNVADVIIYSDALPEHHPLRILGKEQGKKLMAFNEAAGEISGAYRTIAVTGTHGKTTTTALLAKIFLEAGWDPTVLVGGSIAEWENENARTGTSDWLVMEADEYREHFLTLQATHAIVTSIDFDHPDFFQSMMEVKAAFTKFLAGLPEDGNCVVSERSYTELPALAWPPNLRIVTKAEENITVNMPGRHWQRNAALAVAMAEELGIEKIIALRAVKNPWQVGRRLELVGKIGRTEFFSDYGHHPAEISATLEGIKEMAAGRPLTAIVEIHTPERLTKFREQFVQALLPANEIILVPVFIPQGREPLVFMHSQEELKLLAEELREAGKKVTLTQQSQKLLQMVGNTAQKRTVVAFTAGKLDQELRNLFVKNNK